MAEVDPNEQAMLVRLDRISRGLKGDPYEPMGPEFPPLPTHEEQRAAALQYVELKKAIEARVIREQDFGFAVDGQKHGQQLETERLKLEIAKLQLEAAKVNLQRDVAFAQLEVQKADVIVRAIAAAASNPDVGGLGDVVREVSARLLGGSTLPLLQIEEKKT